MPRGESMEALFQQVRSELGIHTEVCQRAALVLCDWLDHQVGRGHVERLLGTANAKREIRLVDRSLAAIEAPHGADVSLAMALRGAGLTLDQADAFVEMFLAHLQLQTIPDWAGSERRLASWLGQPAGEEIHVVPS